MAGRTEAAKLTYEYVAPTADLSKLDIAVEAPALLDAAGVDGRFVGAARSFPGMVRLDMNATTGPLVVGPGITHLNAAGDGVQWVRWGLRTVNGVYGPTFFQYMELLRGVQDSRVIGGFVVALPYTGPVYDPNGDYRRNPGLPGVYSGSVPRYVLAYIYFDDEEYPHPTRPSDSHPPGWRARIINKTAVKVGNEFYEKTVLPASGSIGVSAWDRFGYVAGAYHTYEEGSGGLQQAYGSPDRESVIDGADGGSGPAVLYWDDDRHYIRIRPMGVGLSGDEKPTYITGNAPTAVTQSSGLINASGSGSYKMAVGVTLFNSETGLRSDMMLDATLTFNYNSYYYVAAVLALHVGSWDRFDTLELWRSPVGSFGLLQKEMAIPLGQLPAKNTQYGDSDTTRTFAITWGGVWEKTLPSSWPWSGNFRTSFVAKGATNLALMMRESYDALWEFTAPPPTIGNKLLVTQDVCYMLCGGASPNTPTVRPRLRWSSVVIPRPENFAETEDNWHPDEEVGLVYGMRRVGELIFIVGTRNTIACRRVGDRLVFSTIGENIAPVSRFAWTSGGGLLFVLTREGLYAISAGDQSFQLVDALTYELLSDERWGHDIFAEADAVVPSLMLEYDETGNCLFVVNAARQEALVYWVKTGAVTRLYDFPFNLGTQGAFGSVSLLPVPGGYEVRRGPSVSKAFFIGERYAGNLENVDPWLDVYYADFALDRSVAATDQRVLRRPATMHGEVGVMVSQPPTGMQPGDVEKEIVNSRIVQCIGESGTYGDSGYVDLAVGVPQAVAELPSGVPIAFRRRFCGAFIHLFEVLPVGYGKTKKGIHVRRQVVWAEVRGKYLRVHFTPTITSDQSARLAGGVCVLSPVVVRLVGAKLPVAGGATRVAVASGVVKMDPLLVRMAHPDAESYWIATKDAEQMVVQIVGYARQDGDVSNPQTYGAHGYSSLAFKVGTRDMTRGMVMKYGSPPPPGRFVEAARADVAVSRRESDCAFSLAFGAHDVAVGVEAYPAAVLLELRRLSLSLTMTTSERQEVAAFSSS